MIKYDVALRIKWERWETWNNSEEHFSFRHDVESSTLLAHSSSYEVNRSIDDKENDLVHNSCYVLIFLSIVLFYRLSNFWKIYNFQSSTTRTQDLYQIDLRQTHSIAHVYLSRMYKDWEDDDSMIVLQTRFWFLNSDQMSWYVNIHKISKSIERLTIDDVQTLNELQIFEQNNDALNINSDQL